MKKLAIFIVIASFIVACGGGAADEKSTASNEPAAADAPDGEKLYKTYCVTCHGINGDMGASGAHDLTKSTISLEERIKVITDGRPGTVMVGFKSLLDEAKIKALAEHTQKLQK